MYNPEWSKCQVKHMNINLKMKKKFKQNTQSFPE